MWQRGSSRNNCWIWCMHSLLTTIYIFQSFLSTSQKYRAWTEGCINYPQHVLFLRCHLKSFKLRYIIRLEKLNVDRFLYNNLYPVLYIHQSSHHLHLMTLQEYIINFHKMHSNPPEIQLIYQTMLRSYLSQWPTTVNNTFHCLCWN